MSPQLCCSLLFLKSQNRPKLHTPTPVIVCSRNTRHRTNGVVIVYCRIVQIKGALLESSYWLWPIFSAVCYKLESQHENVNGWNSFATKKTDADANINKVDKEESFYRDPFAKINIWNVPDLSKKALFVLSPFVVQTSEAAERAEGGGRFMKSRNRSRRLCRFCTTIALRIKLTHNRVTLWPLERSNESPVECFE